MKLGFTTRHLNSSRPLISRIRPSFHHLQQDPIPLYLRQTIKGLNFVLKTKRLFFIQAWLRNLSRDFGV
jgi:hypothetical protein